MTFTYTKEKELHEHIVENFHRFFDFQHVKSEHFITSGRIDIVGESDNTLYIVELKRDIVTQRTIDQLTPYVIEMQEYYPDKEVVGIAAAPLIDSVLDVDALPSNIYTQKIEGVVFEPPIPQINTVPITFTLDAKLIEELKTVSKQTMIPQARLVRKAVEEILDKYEKDLDAQK